MYAQVPKVPMAPANMSPCPPHLLGLPLSVTFATKFDKQFQIRLQVKPAITVTTFMAAVGMMVRQHGYTYLSCQVVHVFR